MASSTSHKVHVPELYAPQILTILVGPNARVFQVPRGIVCPLSEYFNNAFNSAFVEGQDGVIKLERVEEWVFECFVGWLYTNNLAWKPDPMYQTEGGPTVPDVDDSSECFHENDRENAVTWIWPRLFDLYLFGDEYDTAGFRDAVLQTCQLKALQAQPRVYHCPGNRDTARVLNNLPETSPLSRFLVDIYVYVSQPDRLTETATLEAFPPAILGRMFTKAVQLVRFGYCHDCKCRRECRSPDHPDIKRTHAPFYYDPCEYHEHETDEARKLCRIKWTGLNAKHELDLELEAL